MASKLTATTIFPRRFSQPLQYLTQHPRFSAHRTNLMTKTDLIFPTFPLELVDFATLSAFARRDARAARARFDSAWLDFPEPITIPAYA